MTNCLDDILLALLCLMTQSLLSEVPKLDEQAGRYRLLSLGHFDTRAEKGLGREGFGDPSKLSVPCSAPVLDQLDVDLRSAAVQLWVPKKP